jgi:hypothetical protein
MKILGKSLFRDWNLVADAAQVTQERLFLKEINRFKANDCNAIASFYGVKNYKSIQRLLSDFKAGIKTTCERLAYFPENIGKHQ